MNIHHNSAVASPSEAPSSSLSDKHKHLAIDSNNEPGHPKPDLAPQWPKIAPSYFKLDPRINEKRGTPSALDDTILGHLWGGLGSLLGLSWCRLGRLGSS